MAALGYAVMVDGVAPMAMRAAILTMRARCSNVTRMWHHVQLAMLLLGCLRIGFAESVDGDSY